MKSIIFYELNTLLKTDFSCMHLYSTIPLFFFLERNRVVRLDFEIRNDPEKKLKNRNFENNF